MSTKLTNKDGLTFIKVGSKTDKHNEIKIKAVPALPLFVTFTVFCVLRINNPPIETKISLIRINIKKIILKKGANQNINKINTIRSVTGSKIMPNLETRLNLRATIPSIESLIPIIAIKNIRLKLENSPGSSVKNMYIVINNLDRVIKLGSKNISL